jgi:predicted deacetylase
MNSDAWRAIEYCLDELGVRPIVAVVPDNQDPELQCDKADPAFWERVRAWQAKGWSIAMHGFRHVYHPVPRKKLVLPFYDRSEFGGLTYEQQASKLRESWRLFKLQDLEPNIWVAPGHCFDQTTLKALRDETPIRIVSDGIACNWYCEDDFYWLPQQLWSLQERRAGLWTVCLHPNSMSERQISELGRQLKCEPFVSRVVGVDDVKLFPRRRTLNDRVFATWFWQRDRAMKGLSRLRAYLSV